MAKTYLVFDRTVSADNASDAVKKVLRRIIANGHEHVREVRGDGRLGDNEYASFSANDIVKFAPAAEVRND